MEVPLWSPDGATIAVGVDSALQLRIIRVSDGEILRTIEKVLGFDLTPGGKDILIASTDGLLSATSIASGSSRSIANWKEIGSSFAGLKGSPDGKWIALIGMYDKGKTVQTHIYLINVANGNFTEVAKDDPGNKAYPIWSPDSKWITYCHIMAPLSDGSKKIRLEGTLWEADLTDFMKKMER